MTIASMLQKYRFHRTDQLKVNIFAFLYAVLDRFIFTTTMSYIIPNTHKIVYSECLLRLVVCHSSVCFVLILLFFLYGAFCHSALKLDISALFAAIFLGTTLHIILTLSATTGFTLCQIICYDLGSDAD